MPTNEQRREAAQRKLERQLERRSQKARQQRILMVLAGVLAVTVAGVLIAVFTLKRSDTPRADGPESTPTTASTAPSASAGASSNPVGVPTVLTRGGPGQLPAFAAPAGLGSDCQYPAAQPAARPVDPPRSGTVPTDPATVSVSMSTDRGNIGLILNNGEAPCTVNSFVSLAQKGFFKDTPCHRLTTAPSLGVLQCGDPTGSGAGGPGYQFPNEYPTNQYAADDPALGEPVLYPRGALAMANAGPDTNGSQFFLVYKDSMLPPNYTVFGTIDSTGLATLDKIAAAGVAGGASDGGPAVPVTIKSVLLD